MNTHHKAVIETAWRRIKKPRRGSLITIQGRPCIVTRSRLSYSGPFPKLSITATARFAAVIVLALLLTGCGYVSGVGATYDPNTGVIGGQVTFPVGSDYKKAHPVKHKHAKQTGEFK